MHTRLQVSIMVVTFAVAFLLGYNISAQSGNEPGYFLAVEAGAYGAVETLSSPTGLSADESEYYKSLLND